MLGLFGLFNNLPIHLFNNLLPRKPYLPYTKRWLAVDKDVKMSAVDWIKTYAENTKD